MKIDLVRFLLFNFGLIGALVSQASMREPISLRDGGRMILGLVIFFAFGLFSLWANLHDILTPYKSLLQLMLPLGLAFLLWFQWRKARQRDNTEQISPNKSWETDA